MKRILLCAVLGINSCAPAYAIQSETLTFTDADIVQPSGDLPACIVEVPEATFILPAQCIDGIQDVLTRFKKLHPSTPVLLELNGESLSGV